MDGKIKGGKPYYGISLGIVLLDQKHSHPQLPGSVSNASTFQFPVRLKIVKGLYDNPFPPVRDKRGEYTEDVRRTMDAARELASEGVRAIIMCCGFFSLLQSELAEEAKIPVFSSSLLMVPLISRLINKHQKVGILTASKARLTHEYLEPAGIDASIPHIIEGMEKSKEFYSCFMGGTRTTLNVDQLRKEVVCIASDFIKEHPDIGALLIECTDLPPYSADIHLSTGIPVFDYVSFVNTIHQAVVQKRYCGFI